MRVVSMQSKAKVYHREECRYAKKILPKNRMQLSSEAAEKRGIIFVRTVMEWMHCFA